MNHKLESQLLGEISTTSDVTTLMAESPLMKLKEESEKAGLKSNIQETKITASDHITSQQTEAEKVEAVKDFTFLGFKTTADNDCGHEIKTLAPCKESYDKPRQRIEKQRHYFANKDLYNQSYDFSSSHIWI